MHRVAATDGRCFFAGSRFLSGICIQWFDLASPLHGFGFIRHGWTKLINLGLWADAMKTPAWLCFLSAFSMWAGGIALVVGFLTPLAAMAIAMSMLYAVVLELRKGFPFIAPDPFQIPQGDYAGPMGVGEPPSWEKAAMYVVMCSVLMTSGGGPISIDLLWVAPRLHQFLT